MRAITVLIQQTLLTTFSPVWAHGFYHSVYDLTTISGYAYLWGYRSQSRKKELWERIELSYNLSWAPKNWCFWTVVLETTLESSLDCKEIQPAHPERNLSWIFIGRTDVVAETPILWPLDVMGWLFWKDPDSGKDWGQKEKGTTEDEMVGCHHWLNGHEFG